MNHNHCSRLVCGLAYTVCIDSNDNIYCIGDNKYGKCGGETAIIFPPQCIKSLSNIKNISCGLTFTACIDYDGNLWTFGDNSRKTLGIGEDIKETHIPQKVNLPPINQVSCGLYFTICLGYDNKLYSFGNGTEGQLGLGSTISYSTPQEIPELYNIEFVACGGYTVICKTFNDEYYMWGDDLKKVAKNIKRTIYSTPSICTNWPNNISCVKFGIRHLLILTNDGLVYSCGSNLFGQLGIGDKEISVSHIPILINNLPEIQQISCGFQHSLCVDIEGNLWVFGYNNFGQLGIGNTNHQYTPIKVDNMNGIIDLSEGGHVTFIRNFNKEIFATGLNSASQLGVEKIEKSLLFKQVFKDKPDIWQQSIIKSKQKSARK